MSAATRLEAVRTCAILHDIGKLECWSRRRGWSEHTFFTFNFVKKCLGEELAWHARRHHTGSSYSDADRPKDEIEMIVSLADRLASGADRSDELERGPPLPSPPIELAHPLSKDKVVSSMSAADLAYLSQELSSRLGPLEEEFRNDPKRCYRKIFDALESSGIRRVPADTRRPVNDVSLWDHLKLTAAFATCIALGGYRGGDINDYEFAVLSGDADRISAFINQSRRLPDLNARSDLVKRATEGASREIEERLGPECLLFAAGGSVLALSPVNMADELLAGMKRRFEEAAEGALTMTVSKFAARGGEIGGDFGKAWDGARSAMALAKGRRMPILQPSLPEGAEACDACGLRPWAMEDRRKLLPLDASPRYERLCSTCWELRERGRGVWLDDLRDGNDLVGCVKMDGDGIGAVLSGEAFKRLNKASTPSRISAVSALIRRICEEELDEVLRKYGALGGKVYAGGDDLLFFTPGRHALRAAADMASRFRERTAGECTMSAGVAIFHYDLPVYAGLLEAEALLRRSKEDGKNRVAFAFLGGSAFGRRGAAGVRSWEWDKLGAMLELAELMESGGPSSSQLWDVASALGGGGRNRSPEFAEALIKSRMGRGSIGWSEGERLLSALESGLLADAFFLYSRLRGG